MNSSQKSSQSALEYLMIIGITFAIIVPTVYLFFSYSRDSNLQITYAIISSMGNEIISNAESIYYSGENSKTVLELTMPDNINNVVIVSNMELIFNLTTQIGEIETVFFSKVNITGNSCAGNICDISFIADEGLQRIRIESINKGKQVLIARESG